MPLNIKYIYIFELKHRNLRYFFKNILHITYIKKLEGDNFEKLTSV